MQNVNDIRTVFLDYFIKHQHLNIASSSLVPENDPTLMFTNSGMVQFKNIFTGEQKRPAPCAVTAQKCVRAGGKHNDLENVGYTARHHTFFEMLGNFSFGDYFKENAIEMAWNLITKEYGLPPEKLLVTIYHDDEEAASYWKKIAHLDDRRIIRINSDDNFWRMGDTGPCGPCSEIFYDHGEHIAGGPPGSPEEDGDRFIEIWNLVFMQFEQISKDKRINLPKTSIDTGMGIERIAAILQGKHDNYDIDIFQNLIRIISDLLQSDPTQNQASHKAIADHIRAICFLIADGVLPSNEGRGYVLRRIMRRAMRHAHLIGGREPFLYQLPHHMTELMGGHYIELNRAEHLIREILKSEEERFQDTLSRGLKILDDEINPMSKGDKLSGEIAFTLYDTYGFPLDLTADILRGQQLELDMQGFDRAMQEQKQRARAAWKGSGMDKTNKIWFELKEETPATEFLGYHNDHNEAVILHLVKDDKITDILQAGDEGIIIVNQTCFYGESGGQIGDSGIINNGDNQFIVRDTQKSLGLFLHYGVMRKGNLTKNDAVHLIIDKEKRNKLKRHHSATHLLHQSLRNHLGTHVAQSGSLVADNHLRFDFSHHHAIDSENLQKIEREVNREILNNSPITTIVTSKETAVKNGALALFGEKYDDEVRVVSMGAPTSDNRTYSVELCGGTHVSKTAEIGLFKILHESSIAAGVRRIEAVCGEALYDHIQKIDTITKNSADILKTGIEQVPNRLSLMQQKLKKIEKENQELRRKLSLSQSDSKAIMVGEIAVMMRTLDCSPKDLKILAKNLHDSVQQPSIVILGTMFDDRVSMMVSVTESLTTKYDAATLIAIAEPIIDGKGGGKKTLAQSGGKNISALNDALNAIVDNLKEV
ncbi:MAG: alanine--tRNA ligase [Alphaproteobacteria bacterium]|nr:alanine--tRNA ligase [Alphaproteobacteria bacterium]